MKQVQTKTANSFLEIKVALRIAHLPNKKHLRILDCFGGDGIIWDEIKRRTRRHIQVVRIDKENKQGVYLRGDNMKFLKSMDLSRYDVIDMDAYGVPYSQLKHIQSKAYTGLVFFTFIQSLFGRLPTKMLYDLGFSKKMVKKCPTLFFRNGFAKFKGLLRIGDVLKIKYYQLDNKIYGVYNY